MFVIKMRHIAYRAIILCIVYFGFMLLVVAAAASLATIKGGA